MYYNLILGNNDDFDSMSKATSVFEDLFFATFFLLTVFFIIIMLNLLIAIISDTNAKVVSVEAKAFQFERLNLINEFEELMSKTEEELLNSKLKGTFLFVLKSAKEIAEEKEMQIEPENTNTTSNSESMIEEKLKDLSNILEQLRGTIDTVASNQEIFKSNQVAFQSQIENLKRRLDE
jgi:hypothetical protein